MLLRESIAANSHEGKFLFRLGQYTCSIAVRLLPKATPELNAMDHLWRHTKRQVLSDRPTITIDQSARQTERPPRDSPVEDTPALKTGVN